MDQKSKERKEIILYEYQKTRHHIHPLEFYKDYQGILETDGLQQYHLVEQKNSIRFRDSIMIEISIRSWKRDVIIKVITPRLSLRVEIYIPHTVTASIPNISKTSMFR